MHSIASFRSRSPPRERCSYVDALLPYFQATIWTRPRWHRRPIFLIQPLIRGCQRRNAVVRQDGHGSIHVAVTGLRYTWNRGCTSATCGFHHTHAPTPSSRSWPTCTAASPRSVWMTVGTGAQARPARAHALPPTSPVFSVNPTALSPPHALRWYLIRESFAKGRANPPYQGQP